MHIINKNLLQNQNGFTAAHHCLRSLLESMVELKDIMELSESDESGSSSTSNSDSGFSSEDDSLDETRSEPVAATQEETEGEFLERQAQTARDLQAEACEEAENGQNEDGHELALGPQLNHSTPTRETLPKLYFAQPTCNIHSILLPITPSRQRETVSCTLAPHASSRMNAS